MKVNGNNASPGIPPGQISAIAFLLTASAVIIYIGFFSNSNVHLFHTLMVPVLYPAVMLSGFSGFLRSRLNILMFLVIVVSSGILLVGNAGGWLSHFSAEPRMWHQGRSMKSADKDAYVVYFNIQNKGRGGLKLSLNPVMSPEEISLVLSAQQYDEVGKRWVDYPINKLLSERSQSMFPLEVRSGGTLLLEMIFAPPEPSSEPGWEGNPSGKYTVTIADPVRMRLYQHEIDVPQFF